TRFCSRYRRVQRLLAPFHPVQSPGLCLSSSPSHTHTSWTKFLLAFLSSSQGIQTQGFTRQAHAPVVPILDCMALSAAENPALILFRDLYFHDSQTTSYSSAPLIFYFVPCAYDISSLCLDYDVQLRVVVFIERDLRWLFWSILDLILHCRWRRVRPATTSFDAPRVRARGGAEGCERMEGGGAASAAALYAGIFVRRAFAFTAANPSASNVTRIFSGLMLPFRVFVLRLQRAALASVTYAKNLVLALQAANSHRLVSLFIYFAIILLHSPTLVYKRDGHVAYSRRTPMPLAFPLVCVARYRADAPRR
ncbi:hypothetical protein B0H13DRAFT_2551468, partial [Mycena leptocephala]